MPDPDRTARELMDAPGTRVTPQPNEHPGQNRPRQVEAQGTGDPAAAGDASPDDLTALEGGTGTAGSRGGGPAADFADGPADARGGDRQRG